jgi:Acyl-CoA dehydrogenase, C-terminal domain
MMEDAELDTFARALHRATDEQTGAALDAVLFELGWQDALADDPRPAVSILFERMGEACATSSALDDVMLDALGLEVVAGSAVVFSTWDRWNPPGRLDDQRMSVHGLGSSRLAHADSVVVVAQTVDGEVAVVGEARDLTMRPVRGMDPWLELVEVTATALDVGSPRPLSPEAWGAAVRLAQLAIGHELVGVATAMIELARSHALGRIQFGRPIGTFQAVRHRLADSMVALEMARAVLAEAWEDCSLQSAAMAKAVAGRSARTTSRHCQQVLAGIGFTTEHPFHRLARRVFALDQLFGSARSLTRTLGQDLIASRRLPTPLPL